MSGETMTSLAHERHVATGTRSLYCPWCGTSLDAAWAEAEAALPEGWQLAGVEAIEALDQSAKAGKDWTRSITGWRAKAMPTSFLAFERTGIGPTPADALRALASRLAEVR